MAEIFKDFGRAFLQKIVSHAMKRNAQVSHV